MKLNTAATVYNAQLPAKKAALMERQLNREAATQRAAPASRAARVPAPAATMRSLSTEPSSRDRLPGLSEGLAEYRRSEGPMSPSRADPPRRPSTGAATRRGQADALAPFGYFTLGPIAAGAFSQVVRARSSGTEALKSGSEVAVKSWTRAKLTRAPHHVQAMKAEVGVLKLLQPSAHTNIANMVELLESRQAIFLVLEYCSGGSLSRYMQTHANPNLHVGAGLPEPMAGAVTSQLSAALMHMHGLGVAHRDIKPDNVLFSDASHAKVQLCDFGFALRCGDRKLRTVCGSAQYMAPELHTAQVGDGYLGPPVDMWALGAMLYEMLHGKPAFRGASMEQLKLRIMRVSHEPFAPTTTTGAKSLVRELLQQSVEGRATARDCAMHSWLPSYSI
eukprot:Transcript_14774.p1 GENE.Transcript_14774~~Transcript_14774.p1  ORF type:complete len:435 (-),score=145.79 Transcript_14774:912-2084(-)